MPLVLGEARESWRCRTGGAEHTRSSLLMVLMDDAPISTAAVASSRRRGRMPRRLLGMDRAGGVLHQKTSKGPHNSPLGAKPQSDRILRVLCGRLVPGAQFMTILDALKRACRRSSLMASRSA